MARMKARTPEKIIIALSGGVDSAVAAMELVRTGHRVEALHMTNWDDEDGYCTAATDLQDAQSVCRDLDIPLHHVNFAAEYRAQVFTAFLADYARGRTPNPDVLCNREIKFGVFLEYARRLGGDRIATGHYARIDAGPPVRLLRGLDSDKDQSYFLHQVPGNALACALFPLGSMHKSEVRRLANDAGLQVHDKRDSTGICFIGERPFRNFLSGYLAGAPGDAVTPDGECVGAHEGLPFYTLGQRQGLGIGGRAGAGAQPWYVAGKNETRNELIVVQGRNHPLLWSAGFDTESAHWIGTTPALLPVEGFRCSVKTRYRQQDVPCRIRTGRDGGLTVQFDSPQWAVTPGQYAVFYAGERCLGGAAIISARPITDPKAVPAADPVADERAAPL